MNFFAFFFFSGFSIDISNGNLILSWNGIGTGIGKGIETGIDKVILIDSEIELRIGF